MVGTLCDLARFLSMLLRLGALPDGQQLIPAELVEEAGRGDPAAASLGSSGFWLFGTHRRPAHPESSDLGKLFFNGMAGTMCEVDFEKGCGYIFLSQVLEGGNASRPPCSEIERATWLSLGYDYVNRSEKSWRNKPDVGSGRGNNRYNHHSNGRWSDSSRGGYGAGSSRSSAGSRDGWGRNNSYRGGYGNGSNQRNNAGGRDVYWKAEGKTAEISEEGYQAVAKLRDSAHMRDFIVRVAASLGLSILRAGDLWGFAPYYSGEKMTQSLQRMVDELMTAKWVCSIDDHT